MAKKGNPAWVKGVSGNPGGAKPAIVNGIHVPTLAREYGPEAIRTLAEIMRDKEAPAAPRVKAAEVLLNRGFGLAPAVVTLLNERRDAEDYTDEELAEALAGEEPTGD
jgi:hypothetical protein